MEPILIAGAGPGGLVAALALKARGIPVVVLERSEALRTAGAGIVLAVNAMRVMHGLGLGRDMEEAGRVLELGGIDTVSGGRLQDFSLKAVAQSFGLSNVGIRRGVMAQILADALESDVLRFSAQVVGVEEVDNGVVVALADGSEVRGAALVGADGIHSAVRTSLWGESTLRYSGQTCWRGIGEVPDAVGSHALVERWHRGRRVGVVPISPTHCYWFATEKTERGGEDGPDEMSELRARFADFGDDVGRLFAATPSAMRNDILDLPPLKQWTRGRVTLLGDAAHAMTPNLGQGACQSIEDGAWLAYAIDNHPLEEALLVYETARKKRVQSIVRRSELFGQISSLENPILRWIRDLSLRCTPQFVVRRGLNDLYGHAAPE